MINPFNSPLEVGVRVLHVLFAAWPDRLDLNRLVLLDHGVLHSADFSGPESLHPPMKLRSGELGMKRERIQSGLEVLLRSGLAQMEPGLQGIQFRASERAASFLQLMETDHAKALADRSSWAVDKFSHLDDDELRMELQGISGQWAEEFETSHNNPLEGA